MIIQEDGRAVVKPGRYVGRGLWLVGDRIRTRRMRASDIEYVFQQLPGYKPPIYRGVPLITAYESSSILLDDATFSWLYQNQGKPVDPRDVDVQKPDAIILPSPEEGDGCKIAMDVERKTVRMITAVDYRQVAEFSRKAGVATADAMAGRLAGDLNKRFYIMFSRVSMREMLDVFKFMLMAVGVGIGMYIALYGLKMLST